MLYGLYLSAQGADVQSIRQDVIANNLANASTNAFKRDFAVFQAHQPFDVERGIPRPVPGNLNASTGGISLADVKTDFSEGPVIATGNEYDVALIGPGFLRVSDGTGDYLTRNGALTVDSTGRLVTRDLGLPLSGIQPLPTDSTGLEIAADGSVWSRMPNGDRSLLGRLDLVQPESLEALEKVGNSLYRFSGAVTPAGRELSVRQGFLEASGVQPVDEMMQLIEASRAFEANVNMIKYQDEALGQLLSTIPNRR